MARERDQAPAAPPAPPAPPVPPTSPPASPHPPPPPKPMKRALVGYPGQDKEEVEYPADAADPRAAAKEAFRAKRGIWSDPLEPEVELEL